MKTAADLVALTRQKTWDKDVVLWVGAEKTLLHILAQLAYVVLDLLDLFDEERLPMDAEETRVRLLRGLCHELQSFQVGPERRTVLVVKSIGLLARYHARVREFYEWFCGDFAMVVLILDGLVDERVWPEEVACNANRLLKYFPEQRDKVTSPAGTPVYT
jgi:hypothetical protein